MSDQEPVKKHRDNREIASIILGLAVVAISIANRRSVKIDWIVATWRMPLIILIVGCLAIGAGAGYMVARRRGKAKDD
jgi:uncharacterized integral membrane protein